MINHFITDLCANSSPEAGLKFSEPTYKAMNLIKKFAYEEIYLPKDKVVVPYTDLVIKTVFDDLNGYYKGKNTLTELEENLEQKPQLISGFKHWLIKYSDVAPEQRAANNYANKVVYSIDNQDDYKMAALEYISSLTDKSAVKFFDEIIFQG